MPLPQNVRELNVRKARLLTTGHALQLTDNIVQQPCFPGGLPMPSIMGNCHHMDMEMVVGRLIYAISANALELYSDNSQCT